MRVPCGMRMHYRMCRCGGAIQQALITLNVSEERWKKLEITALRLSVAINILDPELRFEITNHAPLLPRCVTAIIDSFPKEVMDASCMACYVACCMLACHTCHHASMHRCTLA